MTQEMPLCNTGLAGDLGGASRLIIQGGEGVEMSKRGENSDANFLKNSVYGGKKEIGRSQRTWAWRAETRRLEHARAMEGCPSQPGGATPAFKGWKAAPPEGKPGPPSDVWPCVLRAPPRVLAVCPPASCLNSRSLSVSSAPIGLISGLFEKSNSVTAPKRPAQHP